MSTVSLLRPPALVSIFDDAGPLTPPLGAALLASSLLKAGYHVQIIDGIGEAPDLTRKIFDGTTYAIGLLADEMVSRISDDVKLIGVSCMFSQDWPMVREIITLARAKFPNVTIIAGGEHVTALPEFCLSDCKSLDICAVGEGEETIVALANSFFRGESVTPLTGIVYRDLDGSVHVNPRRSRMKSLDEIPRPAWHLVPLENYLKRGLSYGVNLGRTVPMLATRGCPYQCTFCSSPQMWTTKWSARDPKLVLDEIEDYMNRFQATNFDFYDLTMIVRRDWILEFTRLIADRGLKFTWQLPSGTRSEAIDRDVSRALYATGCRNMSYAPETGSVEELKRIKKKVNLNAMLRSMRGAVKERLNIKCNIVIGFPEETMKDLACTFWLLIRMALLGIHDISISLFSPYPGSELFDRLRRTGKISELNDRYFSRLSAYKDVTSAADWCDSISSGKLTFFRSVGYLLFYGLSYLLRPARLARTLSNIFRKREESRLEKSLIDFFRRRAQLKAQPASGR